MIKTTYFLWYPPLSHKDLLVSAINRVWVSEDSVCSNHLEKGSFARNYHGIRREFSMTSCPTKSNFPLRYAKSYS